MPPTPPFPKIPKLRVRVDDLTHAGVKIFFDSIDPREVLLRAIDASLRWLYTPDTAPTSLEQILLVLRPMEGVAHTLGGSKHKEIHFSLDYILQSQDRAKDEITGVLVHEVVHCYQYFANGTCPVGLTEGIADYVRLRERLGPPHWKRTASRWDAGYDTTAYFLDWVATKYGENIIRELNASLRDAFEEKIFAKVTGVALAELWRDYCNLLNSDSPSHNSHAGSLEVERKSPLHSWPIPKFCVRIEDLDHKGATLFLEAVKPNQALYEAVMATFNCLYTLEDVPTSVGQILLVLRSMDGVAYTTGTASHKEIHFSLDYIEQSQSRAREEIMGVLVHEVVHCFQYDGHGSCPGGLIEGIADFVRLRENLGPPHWRKSTDGGWDAGYERTAYFLDWIETSCGKGTVKRLNSRMKYAEYDATLFLELAGRLVNQLWDDYCRSLEEK